MKTVNHKFLEHQLNPETEILIIGTFNPDTCTNKADFSIQQEEIIYGNY